MIIAEISSDAEGKNFYVEVWDEEDPQTVLRTHGPYGTSEEAVNVAMEREPHARIW